MKKIIMIIFVMKKRITNEKHTENDEAAEAAAAGENTIGLLRVCLSQFVSSPLPS